ncbi:hypothetical protein ZTR_01338 [Talaromyces verruculosus]|nr:hypothetical protein ZTR_01338 [Talaromyces verruculosus]
MPRTPRLIQINDGPGGKAKNDLCLRSLNVEKGSQRFPERDGVTPPQALSWRNNLTALSQRRNLLFVAYSHQIYVWEPAGPRQVLGKKPAMIITPVMRIPDAEGYISNRCPHGINNILVDDLGRDEILLLATDSGNVCGYHVENIFSCIESTKLRGEKDTILNPRIDPFFCENVGLSAWGLAVHKFARLIAVAANTGTITVFAFALAETDAESDDDPTGYWAGFLCEQNWMLIKYEEQFDSLHELYRRNLHRSRNVRISFQGHCTNIPSVSFLSSDLDSDGLWMVSTDIENKMLVWTIWDSFSPVRIFHFAGGAPLPDILRDDERGWSVLALDPRGFRVHQSYFEAFGGKVYLRPFQPSNAVLDVTDLARDLPDASIEFDPVFPVVDDSPEEPVLPDIFDRHSRIKSDSSSICSEDSLSPATSITEQSFESREPTQNQETTEDADQLTFQQSLWRLSDNQMARLVQTIMTNPVIQYGIAASDSDNDSDDGDVSIGPEAIYRNTLNPRDTSDLRPLLNLELRDTDIYPRNPYSSSEHICSDFPILHFSETDIRLLEGPFVNHPSVISDGPLRQELPRTFWSLHAYDRFNMVKYLPEAGIVIAATQKGRAAVITLTQVANRLYALRINWMIPFASQEDRAERPQVGLLGLAVSPMQGFEKRPDIVHVPRGVTSHDDFSFHYRAHGPESIDAAQNWEWQYDSETDSNETDENGSSPPSEYVPELSFAESHGTANWNHMPQESWHGVMPSRHYRVMLTYADHTVMSYEFWYDWTDIAVGESSIGREEKEGEEKKDEYDLELEPRPESNREDHLLL